MEGAFIFVLIMFFLSLFLSLIFRSGARSRNSSPIGYDNHTFNSNSANYSSSDSQDYDTGSSSSDSSGGSGGGDFGGGSFGGDRGSGSYE